MIRVLIAEDSLTIQRLLTRIMNDHPKIKVVGMACNGIEAVEMCRNLQPDLITMDIYMPEMDGLEATKVIMQECPTRIVIVSSIVNSSNLRNSFKAIRSGAIEVIEKPHGALCGNYGQVKEKLLHVIEKMMEAEPRKNMSLYPAKSTTKKRSNKDDVVPLVERQKKVPQNLVAKDYRPSVICFGGSTGAPAVLSTILTELPANYPVPIVIAQHIATGFAEGMAKWFDSITQIQVQIARNGQPLQPGVALIAPDDAHIQFKSTNAVRTIAPKKKDQYVPSIDRLFDSTANIFGPKGLGILLSGMGSDGSNGLKKMRDLGAITLAQNESSSVVYGMPLAAFKKQAVTRQMDPHQIINFLSEIAG